MRRSKSKTLQKIIAVFLVGVMSVLNAPVIHANAEEPGTYTDLYNYIQDTIAAASGAIGVLGSYDEDGDNDEKIVNQIFIELEKDYLYDDETDNNYQYGIPITNDVIIAGNGHYIDGAEMARMFHVSGQSTVSFTNVVFKNGYGPSQDNYLHNEYHLGGAVYIKSFSDVSFDSCEFINNHADNGYGTSIFTDTDSKLSVTYCTFSDDDDSVTDIFILDGDKTVIRDCNLTADDIGTDKGDMGLMAPIKMYTTVKVAASISSFDCGENTKIQITEPAHFTGIVNVVIIDQCTVEGVQITDGEGEVKLNVPYGEYTALISTEDALIKPHDVAKNLDEYYSATECESNSFIARRNPVITLNAHDIYVEQTPTFTGTVDVDNGSKVKIKIDRELVESNVEVVNGEFVYTHPTSLPAGTHTVQVVYDGDEYTAAATKSATFKVNKINTNLTAPSVTATYLNSKSATIMLKDENGNVLVSKKLTVKLGNTTKNYTTNSKGVVSVSVSNLIPGTYTATANFAGDSNYNGSNVSFKVTVKKATPKLTAKAKTFKASVKTKKLTATLKDSKGKVMKNAKLTIKISNKTYSAKTNAKGVATFKITKLTKKGKYNATVKYAGNKYFNKVSKKVVITLK